MKKILVVDDQLVMRNMFKKILSSEYTVDTAVDGREGYKASTGKQYDLIITDYHMPNLNGIEFTKKLRSLDSYRGIPILVVSTESNTNKKQEGRQAGANGWVVKPVSADILLPAVKKLLQ